ncbi:MAG: M43 family zinc metalloprotease [Chitinophagales bacterium]
MKHLITLVSLLGLLYVPILAQQNQQVTRCISTEMLMHQAVENPAYAKAVQQTFEKAQQKVQNEDFSFKDEEDILRVPIVVHIVYNTPEQNLSDELVDDQIAILNRDFRRQNADTTETRVDFLPVADDTGIEFYLATIDPDGNPTNGITRTQTTVDNFSPLGGIDFTTIIAEIQACGVSVLDLVLGSPLTAAQEACVNAVLGSLGGFDAVKYDAEGGKNAWPTDRYLNMWVCNLDDGGGLGLVLGFAYPPAEAPNWPAGSAGNIETDGVVLHYQAFGGPNNPTLGALAGPVGQGRTAVHEVGHYLGLRHIWGDGDCTEDDGIPDTPPAADQSQQDCDYTKNTCDETPDFPDMIENYMDYSDEDCMNMFTRGQVALIRSMLEGPRSTLLGTLEPQAPVADFTFLPLEPNVGDDVYFVSTSTDVESYTWDFGDTNASADANPTHIFTEAGDYEVTLIVQNGVGLDQITYTITVTDNVGINETLAANVVQLWPNPTSGILNVSLNVVVKETANIAVYDVAGREVMVSDLKGTNVTINLAKESNGIYFVKTTVDGKTAVQKVLLQH